MEEYPLPPIDMGSQINLVEKEDRVSKNMVEALAFIEGTPWILVMAQQSPIHTKTFIHFRAQLIFVFLLFSSIVLLVIIRTANFVGTRVREADQRRDDILAKAEHSNKLASIGRLAAGDVEVKNVQPRHILVKIHVNLDCGRIGRIGES